jgi:hypothetical protein
MARSEAQKAADKRYRQAHKNDLVRWITCFKPEEADEINAIIKQSGMSKAEFIRWAVAKYKEQ